MTANALAETFVAWSDATTWSTLPEHVKEATLCRVIDSLGLMLAGSTTPSGEAVRDYAFAQGGRTDSTVIGTTTRLPAALTALVHGTWVHVHDFDDTEPVSVIHPTGPVAATAIAVGEARGASAEEVLASVAVGVEVMCRLGAPAGRRFHHRGFHATGVVGPISAALTAARLSGSDPSTTLDAMGLAGSMSSGVLAFLTDGTWSKRLHPGWAAHGGVTAAELARRGFRGPTAILEDRYGIYAAFLHGESVEPAEAITDVGTVWRSVPAHFKRFPCAHVIQPFLDAVTAARPSVADIAHLELRLPRWQAPIVCEPWPTKTRPLTEYQARTSLPYAVAVAVADGHVGIDSFDEQNLHRSDLQEVMQLMTYTVDDDLQDFDASVVIRLQDGTSIVCDAPVGEPSPIDTVAAKLPHTAGRVLEATQLEILTAGLRSANSEALFDPVAFIAGCAQEGQHE